MVDDISISSAYRFLVPSIFCVPFLQRSWPKRLERLWTGFVEEMRVFFPSLSER
jgi:hypothetical protein